MSFDNRDIRPNMDVYTGDNVYLGCVLETIPGPAIPEGEIVTADAKQASNVNGEAFGPMPTQPIGNSGPITQSAEAGYATAPDSAPALGRGSLIVGKWWGLVGRRTIPIDAVQSVSMERVILRWRGDELTAGHA